VHDPSTTSTIDCGNIRQCSIVCSAHFARNFQSRDSNWTGMVWNGKRIVMSCKQRQLTTFREEWQ
jgi:hypothetical protein